MLSTCPKTVVATEPLNTRVFSSWIEIGDVIGKEFRSSQGVAGVQEVSGKTDNDFVSLNRIARIRPRSMQINEPVGTSSLVRETRVARKALCKRNMDEQELVATRLWPV